MRLADLVGLLALATLLGALMVGQWLVIPLLHDATHVDANLARALAAPLELRAADLALVGAALAALVAPWWIEHRLASTVGLLVAAGTAAHRFVLLPRAQQAWTRVDLVSERPVDRFELAQAAQTQDDRLVVLVLAGAVLLAVGASLRRRARLFAESQTTAEVEAGTTPSPQPEPAPPATPPETLPAQPVGRPPVGAAA